MKYCFRALALALGACAVSLAAHAATVSIVGTRTELDNIATGFSTAGDTVTRYGDWSSLTASQLAAIFGSDIVWEGDIFNSIPVSTQTMMRAFVEGNGGLLLTAERPCCESHNAGVQAIGRALTGDAGLMVGGLGYDLYDHTFSNSPTTILTDPNNIRGQEAQHNGPGRVEPTGGVASDACFIQSVTPATFCTAAAWGPDLLTGDAGRLIIYGDINSQPSLVGNYNAEQFENLRKFLLAGFSGGGDVCVDQPNLPGCGGSGSVPEPVSLALLGVGFVALRVARCRSR